MNTLLDFLTCVWHPGSYFYCLGELTTERKNVRHHFNNSIEDSAIIGAQLSKKESNLFFSPAVFGSESRKAVDALGAFSFWLDLDVGGSDSDKKYPSYDAAVKALEKFIERTNLPRPLTVCSGYGLHAYFLIDSFIPKEQWKDAAKNLATLTNALGLLVDTTRTQDIASLMRLPFSKNWKDREHPRDAFIAGPGDDPVSFDFFSTLLIRLLSGAILKEPKRHSAAKTNDDFLPPPVEFLPFDALEVAERCPQLAHMRDTKGNIPEPLWYANLQVLKFARDGATLAHKWSEGHPDYSFEETERRLERLDSMSGPTTCGKFESINPSLCDGCSYKDKVSTPAQTKPVLPEVKRGDIPYEPPYPFRRTVQGIFTKSPKGVPILVFPGDLYVYDRFDDLATKKQLLGIRASFGGRTVERLIESNATKSPAELFVALFNAGIPVDNEKSKLLLNYIVRCTNELVTVKGEATILTSRLGWQRDYAYVLGDYRVEADGSITQGGISPAIAQRAEGFGRKGTLEGWIEGVKVFSKPGNEALAFGFLCGFGSPLIQFSNVEGSTVSLFGPSGRGKTTALYGASSVFGDPVALKIGLNDTANSRVSRIATYNSMCATYDEITMIEEKELTSLLYAQTSGREKDRLRQDSTPIEARSWRSLLLVSSNDSLVEKLGIGSRHKAVAVRLLELPVSDAQMTQQEGAQAAALMRQHYGHAGAIFAQYIVKHREDLQRKILETIKIVSQDLGCIGEERFWTSTFSVVMVGAYAAKDLGLLPDFDLERIFGYAKGQFVTMRKSIKDMSGDKVQFLNDFITQTITGRLVVRKENGRFVVLDEPKMGLVQRYEADSKKLFISKTVLKGHLQKAHISIKEFEEELLASGVLIRAGAVKNLTIGWEGKESPSATRCYEFDASHTKLELEE